jgi:murein DD-endopeptidase MepM/ murein hydrolase activator NlpD
MMRRPSVYAPHVGSGWDLPLRLDAEEPSIQTRSDVHLRWMGASLLIGLTGAVLLGASLYTAGEGSTPVEPPERMAAANPAAETGGQAARKGDKLTRNEMIVAARKTFQAPTIERVGDHEVIKTHNYVEIATDLSLTADAKPSDIPPFNPAQMLEEGDGQGTEIALDTSSDPSDAAVTLVKQSLQYVAIEPDAPTLSDDEVARQIRELRHIQPDLSALPVDFSGQRILSRTLRVAASDRSDFTESGPETRFHRIDVRVLPENLTTVPETNRYPAPPLFEERDIVLKQGETLASVLKAAGATPEKFAAIAPALSRHAQTELTEGQHIRLLIAPEGNGRGVARITLYGEDGIEEIVATNDRGRFVSVSPPTSAKTATTAATDDDDSDDSAGISLYESLYGTALKNGVPRPIIDDLVRIFSYGVDLKHRTASGDRLTLFFTLDEDSRPDLLYVSLKYGDETKRVYRYKSGAGDVDYFDEDGRSLKKFLLRRPVSEGRISSPFGYRFHPILGYGRLHNGVDWAAPRGTPIMASGDGTVEAAGVHSGYGNRVELVHANGYGTAYNHMSRIANGIVPGAHVKLGQVIGFVGTTGLSTGPHVHYEVTINGRFVDPMKIRLPSGRELAGNALVNFKQGEQQIDDLRARRGAPGPTTVASHT